MPAQAAAKPAFLRTFGRVSLGEKQWKKEIRVGSEHFERPMISGVED
jgi:hypothetical protein